MHTSILFWESTKQKWPLVDSRWIVDYPAVWSWFVSTSYYQPHPFLNDLFHNEIIRSYSSCLFVYFGWCMFSWNVSVHVHKKKLWLKNLKRHQVSWFILTLNNTKCRWTTWNSSFVTDFGPLELGQRSLKGGRERSGRLRGWVSFLLLLYFKAIHCWEYIRVVPRVSFVLPVILGFVNLAVQLKNWHSIG